MKKKTLVVTQQSDACDNTDIKTELQLVSTSQFKSPEPLSQKMSSHNHTAAISNRQIDRCAWQKTTMHAVGISQLDLAVVTGQYQTHCSMTQGLKTLNTNACTYRSAPSFAFRTRSAPHPEGIRSRLPWQCPLVVTGYPPE